MKKIFVMALACCLLSSTAYASEQAVEATPAPSCVEKIAWHDYTGLTGGYLVLYEETGVWEVKFSSSYGDMMLEGTYLPDGTMEYDKDSPIFGYMPMDEITAAGAEVIKAFEAGEGVIGEIDPASCDHKWWKSACIICGTPCSHESWSKGVCATCGYKCPHEAVDAETRLCGQCGMFIAADPADCVHRWTEEGSCALCGMECEKPDWTEGGVFEFDMHTEAQKAFIASGDWPSAETYAPDGEKSHPKALICDFSEDEGIGEAEEYIFQKAADEAFTDPVTVEGLTEASYELYNTKLGEHFFWRGGTSLEEIAGSPVHEVIVNDVGPRTIQIEGLMNVRDIGGYASYLAENGVIRQGLYFRGAAPNEIRDIGRYRWVNELGITAEIDLRDEHQLTGPYVDGVDYYPVPIPSGTESTRFEEFAEEYQKIFEVVSHADEKPIYLHCTAGADRTGISTFILLTVCGVDYEDIAKDYTFTNFSGQRRDITALETWWSKLEAFEGETMADKAASWLLSKGVPAETIENIRVAFIEGYER